MSRKVTRRIKVVALSLLAFRVRCKKQCSGICLGHIDPETCSILLQWLSLCAVGPGTGPVTWLRRGQMSPFIFRILHKRQWSIVRLGHIDPESCSISLQWPHLWVVGPGMGPVT